MTEETIDVLIVGGGLSGLSLGHGLAARDSSINFLLVEARSRFGGRILSTTVKGSDSSAAFDLGPAWFWPGQPRIAALVEHRGLESFDQFASGDFIYQDHSGVCEWGQGAPSQRSHRLAGGLSALVDSLAGELEGRSILETSATHVSFGAQGSKDWVTTILESSTGSTQTMKSQCVVLALPPRLAADSIQFESLEDSELQLMRAIPTWMAGHAKVVAVYDRPFWREVGLSGDAFSRRGPLAEIHDASPARGGPYALFGFVGVAPGKRINEAALLKRTQAQLVELFGDDASSPISLLVKDWAFDAHTATELDHQPLNHHPSYGLPSSLASLWGGRLIFGSTEVASDFGGYLEGALEASENAVKKVASVLGK